MARIFEPSKESNVMKKAICTICNEELGVSKHVNEKTYICYVCDWKMKHNIPIKLGRKGDKNLHRKGDMRILQKSL